MSYTSYLDNPFKNRDMFTFATFLTRNIHNARKNSREQLTLAGAATSGIIRQSHRNAASVFAHQERAFRRVWTAFLDSLDIYAKDEIFEHFFRTKHYGNLTHYREEARS